MQFNNQQPLIEAEKHFLTRSGEKLLFAARKHIFVLVAPIIVTVIFVLLSIFAAVFLESIFHFPIFIVGGLILFLLLAAGTLMIKVVVDWYFQFYVITNCKVLEVCYKPFFSKDIYVVPLDQLRCVEVNSRTQGFINTLYDFGDVIVKLDFLTHQDTFVMTNISSPQATSLMLSDIFNEIISKKINKDSSSFFPNSSYPHNTSSTAVQQDIDRYPGAQQVSFSNTIQRRGGESYDYLV